MKNSTPTLLKVNFSPIGIDGNAYAIMAAFSKAARRDGYPKDSIDAVIKDAMSGDYDHLLSVIMHNSVDSDD